MQSSIREDDYTRELQIVQKCDFLQDISSLSDFIKERYSDVITIAQPVFLKLCKLHKTNIRYGDQFYFYMFNDQYLYIELLDCLKLNLSEHPENQLKIVKLLTILYMILKQRLNSIRNFKEPHSVSIKQETLISPENKMQQRYEEQQSISPKVVYTPKQRHLNWSLELLEILTIQLNQIRTLHDQFQIKNQLLHDYLDTMIQKTSKLTLDLQKIVI